MRFIPSYAAHKTCTLVGAVAFIHAISTAAAAASPPVRPGQGGHTNLATIMSDNHEPINLHIPTNGDIAYADLNQRTDINEAMVLRHVKAVCFFWRSNFPDSNHDQNYATRVFTVNQVATNFANTDRVYCYDGSRDREGIFTLFIEPDDEQVRAAGQFEAELLRVNSR